MTKRIKYMSLLMAVIMCFSLLIFVGCDSEQETANNFNYDQLLEMPIEYVGESDRIVFESWEQRKEYILLPKKDKKQRFRPVIQPIEIFSGPNNKQGVK